MDEAELIQGAKDGDRIAARELYTRYAPAVYRLVFRMVGEEGLAEEFTQDTFIRVFSHLGTFRGDSALGTWIHSVAVSCVLNGMRKVKRIRNRETGLELAESVPSQQRSRLAPDLKESLARAIDALPLKLRTAVILHDLEGYSHPEIAQMTGVPEGTCKTRLAGARSRLREALAPFALE